MPDIISKADVVRKQLSEAIRLFFEERDTVAIHTLVASAHQILVDLSPEVASTNVLKGDHALKGQRAKEYLKLINGPYNFFKHADRDPDARVDLEPLRRLTQDFIMDAVVMYAQSGQELPFEAKVFWHWFVSTYPEDFDNLPRDGEIAKMQTLDVAGMSFKEIALFLKFNEVMGDDA